MIGNMVAALLGCWLAVVAVRKLRGLRRFRAAILTWQLLDPRRVEGAAKFIALLELALGASLVITAAVGEGRVPVRAAALATGLTYVCGQLAILHWNRNATCGCTGRRTGIGAVSLLHASLVTLAAAIALSY